MASILVADDDANIRDLMTHFLQNEGFEVVQAANGVEALSILESTAIDLIIIDIMMPHMDGWELCKEIRDGGWDIPILMVTAKGETGHKVKGFQLGTDDYLTKPFDPIELVVRTRALLKRYRITSSQTIQLGDVTLDSRTQRVIRGDQAQGLPPKEFELLFKLAGNPEQIYTREQLIFQIWGADYEGDDRTVDVHIKRLRERFGGDEDPFRIVTARGLGYFLEVRS